MGEFINEPNLSFFMILFFNEFSSSYPCSSLYDAKDRMSNLIKLLSQTKSEGFRLCRIYNEYTSTILYQGYLISDWLNDQSVKRIEKQFFLSYVRPPFETGETEKENQFIERYYKLNEPEEGMHHDKYCAGLAWAVLYNTLPVSFPSNNVWEKININLLEIDGDVVKKLVINHASKTDHVDYHSNWISRIKPVQIIKSKLSFEQKKVSISLRDDHGQDVLYSFALKLINDDYVETILCSLPFNPHCRKFIKEIYADGRIDITLFEYDAGYSMIVKTTGRNLRETEVIAKHLKNKYYG